MLVIRRIVLGLVFTWFFFGSLGHFFDATFFAGLVPSYVPFPHAAVAITGACELLGAVGLLIAKTRTAAGLGLFVLTPCVTPVHFNMLLHSHPFTQFHSTFFSVRLTLTLP